MHSSLSSAAGGVFKKLALGAALAVGLMGAAQARDTISVVGSSTVFPFTAAVAENFGRTGNFKTPRVESTGTGGGFRAFCAGVGPQHPDIANASRRITAAERETCRTNGVTDIVEIRIGSDGIVLANSARSAFKQLSPREIFLALARDIPDPSGAARTIPNPHQTWRSVAADLPADRIEVLGPPSTSGTRDAFNELAMQAGCRTFPWLNELRNTNRAQFDTICNTMRTDGRFIDAGENDNVIVQRLQANPTAVGIFGYSFLDHNRERLRGAIINGAEPTFENIAAGRYPLVRSMFIYVKRAHVGTIPGLREFIAEYTSERAWGERGYLIERGLIPMPRAERDRVAAAARELQVMR